MNQCSTTQQFQEFILLKLIFSGKNQRELSSVYFKKLSVTKRMVHQLRNLIREAKVILHLFIEMVRKLY